MIDYDFKLYTRQSLDAATLADLQEIAAEKEIEGRSDMGKGELIDAIMIDQSEDVLPLIGANIVLGNEALATVVANLEARLRALELYVQGLDERTRPPTQIMGS